MKTCSKCKETKEFSAFHKNGRLYNAYCKPCLSTYNASDAQRARRRSYAKTAVQRDVRKAYKQKDKATIQVTATRLLDSAKGRAKIKCVNYDLDHAWLCERLARPCALTGMNFVLGNAGSPQSPSLDRVKPELGYTKANVRVITTQANLARNRWGDATLLAFCESVIKTISSQALSQDIEGSTTIPKGSTPKQAEARGTLN